MRNCGRSTLGLHAPRRIPIYGYVYDVRSGRLLEVPDATTEGRAG